MQCISLRNEKREGEMSGMQEEKEMLYVCGRFKERKGDDYCDPATIERDEVEDDRSKQIGRAHV